MKKPETEVEKLFSPQSILNVLELGGMCIDAVPDFRTPELMHWLQEADGVAAQFMRWDKNNRRGLFYPSTPAKVALWSQTEGISVIRVGGWRQRQHPLAVSAGEVAAIIGIGKRAFENPVADSSCGVLLEILPEGVTAQG